MSRMDTFFGAALGAAIVGATLLVREVMEDTEKRTAIRQRVAAGAKKVGDKAGEVYGVARRKVAEVGTAVRERAEKSETVRRVRTAAEKLIRRKGAEPAPETAEEENIPVAYGEENELPFDPLASDEDAALPAT